MKKYEIVYEGIWIWSTEVEAKSKKEAMKIAAEQFSWKDVELQKCGEEGMNIEEVEE